MKNVFAFLISIQFVTAQNLVPNPSFEKFSKCPYTYSVDPKDFGAIDWTSPSKGTPDYYNRCSIGDMDVPNNWAGISMPHSGVGYVGIYAWGEARRNYREYVQCKLTEPLKANEIYTVRFFYRLSLYSVYAIDRVGFALSNEEVHENGDELLDIKPAFVEIKSLETMTNAWMMVNKKIKAIGGEQFLIIGNFSGNDSTESVKIEVREGKSLMLGSSAYYYIDDVSVVPETKQPAVADSLEIKTPTLNEVYVLKHIQFQLNSYELLPSSLKELNELVLILKKNATWRIELSGHTDDQGSDEFNFTLSQNRAKSVGDYLVKNGIETARIKTQGFGKQKPKMKSIDENARAINRRVEAKFLD